MAHKIVPSIKAHMVTEEAFGGVFGDRKPQGKRVGSDLMRRSERCL